VLKGFDAVASTMGAFGDVAPARAQVVPEVGFGRKVVEPVWLVCDPVLVPKFCTDVCPMPRDAIKRKRNAKSIILFIR
jgi:hypothetical protein